MDRAEMPMPFGYPNEKLDVYAPHSLLWTYTCNPVPEYQAVIQPRAGAEHNYWLIIYKITADNMPAEKWYEEKRYGKCPEDGLDSILLVRAIIENFIEEVTTGGN